MTNDIAYNSYRSLLYFFENNIPVHFKDLDNIFYNGLIVDLNEKKLTLVLHERVRGEIPFLLENIKTDSIAKFEEKGVEE